VWQVAFGKAKPGNAYPSIYITGKPTIPIHLTFIAVMDFNDMNTTMTWIPLDNVKLPTGEGSRRLAGDLEVYGTVYIGTGSSGYIVGTMT